MRLTQYSDRLYELPFTGVPDRPNLYYVKGDCLSLVMDAGSSPAHVAEFYSELRSHDLPMPAYTVISHWHFDHSFGLSAIEGQSMSTAFTHDRLQTMTHWEWTREAMREREDNHEELHYCNKCIAGEFPDLNVKVATTDIVIERDTTLQLGGVSVRLIPQSSPHCQGLLFVYVPEEKALLVSDGSDPDWYFDKANFAKDSLSGHYDSDKTLQLIDFLEHLDFEYLYVGHAARETKAQALKRLQEAIKEPK